MSRRWLSRAATAWAVGSGRLAAWDARTASCISAAKRIELLAAAQALRLRVDREPVPLASIDALADRHHLSAYDAAYLALALRRNLPLAAFDAALLAAMAQAGVPAPLI